MRILIPSVQVPFIDGGATLMTNGLKDALLEHGHEAEIVTMPFKFSPNSYIQDSMQNWKNQDFNDFNGINIDRIISLQFPAYYTQHRHITLWLMHQHRSVYDLYDAKNSTSELKFLKQNIQTNDTNILSKIKKRFTISKTVAHRLKHYNKIEATPLYHPPHNAQMFYCDESYDYVFYPSRLTELKRQSLLIEAMSYTKTPIKAIIAGFGSHYSIYQAKIDKLNINHKVKLIGQITQDEKFSFYAHSLAVVFPPIDEDYGYITLEAMLSSKPVVTCKDSGGTLEFVVDNETGFVIDAEAKELAQKLDWIYLNKQKTKDMGKNALESYHAKNINWNTVVQKLLED